MFSFIPNISYLIRHCKICIAGRMHKRHVLLKLEQKTQRRKNLSLNRVFHKLDNNKWKMHTGARARKQKYISIYISLYMKTFLKTGVYIYIYIDLQSWITWSKTFIATQSFMLQGGHLWGLRLESVKIARISLFSSDVPFRVQSLL